ncbi:MAG: XdhC family protein [Pseudomonadota bacterium]
MTPGTLKQLIAARQKGAAVCLVTREDTGSDKILSFEDVQNMEGPLAQAAQQAFSQDQQQSTDLDGTRFFLTPFNPPVRIIIVGAVHISQALLPMLSALSFSTVIIDPRGAFARQERFESANVINDWPDDALSEMTIGHRDAIITLTHDPKLDDPALQTALKSKAFYIGALGSRRTHAKRVERLTAAGFTANNIDRISAPVGLNIGGRSPAEIALSIAADIVQALRSPQQ